VVKNLLVVKNLFVANNRLAVNNLLVVKTLWPQIGSAIQSLGPLAVTLDVLIRALTLE
jgi:hypothetical protein